MKIPTKFWRAGSNFLNHICRVLVKRHTAKAKNTRQIKGPRGLPKLFAVCFFGTAHGKHFCRVPYGLAHGTNLACLACPKYFLYFGVSQMFAVCRLWQHTATNVFADICRVLYFCRVAPWLAHGKRGLCRAYMFAVCWICGARQMWALPCARNPTHGKSLGTQQMFGFP